MPFTVTKGIVSAVGKFPPLDPDCGFKRTLPSILATAAVLFSTQAGK
jgi:hypothetical protein